MTEDPKQPSSKVVEEHMVPIIEERVRVNKVIRDGRTITVRTKPIIEDVTINETVSSEQVELKRVPFDTIVDEVPAVRQEGDVTIIPVVEERLVISKELVLVEEIHLHKRSSAQNITRTIELTRLQVKIDDNEK